MTETDLCNMALSHIGEGLITSLDDDNETARICKQYYQHARRLVLSQYMWGFARRVEPLAKIQVETYTGGYKHTYLYPEHALRIYRIIQDTELRNGLYASYTVKDIPNYEVFNLDTSTKAIGTNITSAYVDYIFDTNDPDIFPPIFVEALTRFLAASLAQSLVGNMEMYRAQFQIYQGALLEAKNIIASERQFDLELPVGYIESRRAT